MRSPNELESARHDGTMRDRRTQGACDLNCLPAIGALLGALWLLPGCATPEPGAVRHPAYRPAEIRRPAVVLQVSLDQTGFGEGEFTSEERASLPEQFEARLIDGLNAQGIFPLDVALTANRAYRKGSSPFDHLDRGQALARARSLGADVLLLADMHLGRRDLVHCRGARRPFVARTTVVAVTLEVLRAADGTRLLLEPPAADLRLTDVEAECAPERSVRRLSAEELSDAAISRILTRLTGR